MAKQFTVDHDDPKRALKALISRSGFDPADFEIAEHKGLSDLDEGAYRVQMLTLRRRGTGIRCTYEIANNAPWLFAPFSDLTSGKYGFPARMTVSEYHGA